MKLYLIGIWLLGLSASVLAQQSIEPHITVYTTQAYQVENSYNAKLYYLDQVIQLEDQFTQHFSDDPEKAEQQALSLFNSSEWAQQEVRLKQAYEGVISGWQNGIKKVPAILFQAPGIDDAVIYGMTDVKQAQQMWQVWLQQLK